MPILLNDGDIIRLITEPKILPKNYQEHIKLKHKRGHKEAELDLDGVDGSRFRLIMRQSSFDPFDFSVILAYHVPKTNVLFRLRRYNGKSHEHTNKIEGETIYRFDDYEETFAAMSRR